MKRSLPFLFLLAFPAAASTPPEPSHVAARLVADAEALAPGVSFRLGVRLLHAPGWHTYYREPGDAGMATKIDWDLPPGFTAGPLEWPPARRLEEASIVTHVYDGAVTLWTVVVAPKNLPRGTVTLRAKASWLECHDICLPGRAVVSLALPVEERLRPHPDAAALFAAAPAPPPPPTVGFWASLGLAFLGGMLLNLMPCVLPVLSIKILGFLNRGEESSSRRHALLYSAGVLASFWALAGLLLAFRAAGRGLGWGFQLQSPVFVGFLTVLFLALALNLFGLFEVGVSLTRLGGGAGGAFGSGVLAVVAATPCTAPFMGAALGYAVTRPPLQALAVFTSLGLGMAWPYAALTASPRFLRFVPKPGPWMLTLKKILGLLLLGTAVWLGAVFARQMGLMKTGGDALAWEPFSEARVAELRGEGRPVFVDFTAAWCLTCQVNERVALRNKGVVERFRALNVAALKADWTNSDPAITKALAAFGRSSVPFAVLYPADPAGAPKALPTLLSPGIMLDALNDLKKE